VSRALAEFMATMIDYAGLFPPAALEVPAAVAEYAKHRGEPEAWMLGRFIAPAARLADVGAAAAPRLGSGPVWEFSVLVGARDSAAAALETVATQGRAVADFESAHAGRARVVCLEAPLPTDAPADFVARFVAALDAAGLGGRDLFLELLPGGDDAAAVARIAAIGAGAPGSPRVGAKLRCGGVTADAFPSVARVAAVLGACAAHDLPLKCTAGLHHPVRHRAAEPEVMMHGFLNVFGAGLLAWRDGADQALLEACVAETEAAAFTFTDEAFAWRDRTVATEDVRRIRRRALAGFGSCSFAEPRADLQALGML
jgi:hypothetical protein